mmetsp:Transcript_27404/g.82242  ORF Transcript_27404/g.82242 Transcript_27404/m.82242 type:complete len:294 (-) Transcript_27404:22-903(-)
MVKVLEEVLDDHALHLHVRAQLQQDALQGRERGLVQLGVVETQPGVVDGLVAEGQGHGRVARLLLEALQSEDLVHVVAWGRREASRAARRGEASLDARRGSVVEARLRSRAGEGARRRTRPRAEDLVAHVARRPRVGVVVRQGRVGLLADVLHLPRHAAHLQPPPELRGRAVLAARTVEGQEELVEAHAPLAGDQADLVHDLLPRRHGRGLPFWGVAPCGQLACDTSGCRWPGGYLCARLPSAAPGGCSTRDDARQRLSEEMELDASWSGFGFETVAPWPSAPLEDAPQRRDA